VTISLTGFYGPDALLVRQCKATGFDGAVGEKFVCELN